MKFYNPFRWHVVRLGNGRYCVRRASVFWMSWCYHDPRDEYVWASKKNMIKYCTIENKEDAIALCKGLRSDEVERVYP